MRLRTYLLPPVVFVLAGPGIGILTAFAYKQSSSTHGLATGILIIYAFAWMPALASGCLYVLLWPLFRRLQMLGTYGIGCVTGLATVAPLPVLMALSPHASGEALLPLVFAVPAALCGMLAAPLRAGGRDR